MQGGNVRRDPTLRHYGVKADLQKDGEGGHYWLIAGGDVVLFASSDVPVAERDIWNPTFEHVLASLEITRDDGLALRQLTDEVLALLRQHYPGEDFRRDEKGIRGGNRVVFMSNLDREVRAAPARRAQIIQHFVQSLGESLDLGLGRETWADAQASATPHFEAPQLRRIRFRQPAFARERVARRCGDLLRPPEQGHFPVRDDRRRRPLGDGR